ncbi:MAG: hypothetical protein ABJZ55_24740 [Fuerstiella sp.]
MIDRPNISATLLAEINETAATRLLRKLDKDPAIADSWAWSDLEQNWNVNTGSENVSLARTRITQLSQIECSCLLSPKCFHILAVSNVLEILHGVEQPKEQNATDVPDAAQSQSNQQPAEAHNTTPDRLTVEHVQSAKMMFSAVSNILGSGLRATASSLQSKLLRAIHECRSTGLHRLAAAGLRILNQARLIRTGSNEFLPGQAVQSVQEALLVSQKIETVDLPIQPQWIGTARRRYRPVASLKLFGLCCEPVLTASGYAGIVTWMVSEKGNVVSLSDVQPGTATRIHQAWKTSVTLAGLALSHADLSQQKLLISKATISEDGRVGGSDSAKAVPSKHEGWNCDAITKRFAEPLPLQIRRYFEQQDAVGTITNEGADLMFLTGTVCGLLNTALLLQTNDGTTVKLTIAADTKDLPYRDNLTMLARVPGLRINALCRLMPLQLGHFQLLSIGQATALPTDADSTAVGCAAEGSAVPRDLLRDDFLRDDLLQGDLLQDRAAAVPELKIADGIHIDIGLEILQRSSFNDAEKHPVNVETTSTSALQLNDQSAVESEAILNDWLQAIVTGGRHALSRSAIRRLITDARILETNFQPTASQTLKTLAARAIDTETTFAGSRFPADSRKLAEAWLAAAIVSTTTHQHRQHAAWQARIESQSQQNLDVE